MIKVLIEENKLVVTGHAGFANNGFDIVCASVSTAVMMSINQIEIFGLSDNIKTEIKEGYCSIDVVIDNDIITKVISNLIYTLKDLESQYSKFIKISENI